MTDTQRDGVPIYIGRAGVLSVLPKGRSHKGQPGEENVCLLAYDRANRLGEACDSHGEWPVAREDPGLKPGLSKSEGSPVPRSGGSHSGIVGSLFILNSGRGGASPHSVSALHPVTTLQERS